MQFKNKAGMPVVIPSKKTNDYIYNNGKYEPKEVELIDFLMFDLIEGDGTAAYQSHGLLDLLRKQKMLISDCIMHASLYRADKIREYNQTKEKVNHAKAKAVIKFSEEGWKHQEKGIVTIKTSVTSIDKLVDGDGNVVDGKVLLADVQADIDKLSARKEQLEREYFNLDDSIKTLSKIMNVGW